MSNINFITGQEMTACAILKEQGLSNAEIARSMQDEGVNIALDEVPEILRAMNSRDTDIISRKEASELGLKKYFTGKPCLRGHVSQRYMRDRRCTECVRQLNSSNRIKEALKYAEDNAS